MQLIANNNKDAPSPGKILVLFWTIVIRSGGVEGSKSTVEEEELGGVEEGGTLAEAAFGNSTAVSLK